MRKRLSKEESRQRYAEGRKLWNEFDPIGVFSIDDDWPLDEYESYVGPSLRLCEEGKGPEEIGKYAEFVAYDRMGLSRTESSDSAIKEFSIRFHDWYHESWPDTVV